MSFNVEHKTDRIKMMGASSSQCLSITLELYVRSVGGDPIAGMFRHGMQHAEELKLPLNLLPERLPPPPQRDAYMQMYFERIHLVYPLFQIDETKAVIRELSCLSDYQLRSLPTERIPLLASAYLIMSIGADEDAKTATEIGARYLELASSLIPQLIFLPYLPSVQALLLLVIILRSRSKDGVGWEVLGIAIRIAHTLGLHRHSAARPSAQHGVQRQYDQLFHARIWAICCCLEKIMQLEAGRPTAIQEVDSDQMMLLKQRAPGGKDFLGWQMGLAEYQGKICQQLYTPKRSGVLPAKDILTEVMTIDSELMAWASSIEPAYRPGEGIVCPSYHFHAAAFLSIQYHQSVIALHRAALIAPCGMYESEIRTHLPDDSSNYRLLNGESICINAARSIARLVVEIDSRGAHSRIMNPGPYLLACIVMAIALLKKPRSRFSGSDLELLKACAECTSNYFLSNGMNKQFAEGSLKIYEAVRKHVEAPSPVRSMPGSRPTESVRATRPTPESRSSHNMSEHRAELTTSNQADSMQFPYQADPLGSWSHGMPPDNSHLHDLDSVVDPPFEGYNVEDLWGWMLSSVDDPNIGWDPFIVSNAT
ncbi:Cutinase transcription factor 1 alpha [Elsinoe australis]|uniref:Cutinase transcription factor 1 alpha n=1 Tax=Elsinoe australis TaxID=40998 RepID=A0A2P7Z3U8_9PEZI|nr:Cutinase transcription factor 1 alpha [Elsinoe australis]